MSKAKILTKEIAQEFISNPTLDLSQFDTIEDDAASIIARYKKQLDLDGLSSLSQVAAQSLAPHKGWLSVGLTNLSDATIAKLLAQHAGPLWLPNLDNLTDAAARQLAQHKGNLGLGIKSLGDVAADALATHAGYLDLPYVLALSNAAAKALAGHKGVLCFHNLEELSDSPEHVSLAEKLSHQMDHHIPRRLAIIGNGAASALSQCKAELYLYSLKSLTDLPGHLALAEKLSQQKGNLELGGLTVLSEAAAAVLAKYKGKKIIVKPEIRKLLIRAKRNSSLTTTKRDKFKEPPQWQGGRIIFSQGPANPLKGRGAKRVNPSEASWALPKKLCDWFVRKLDDAHKTSISGDGYNAGKSVYISPEAAKLLRKKSVEWSWLCECEVNAAEKQELGRLQSLPGMKHPKELQDGKVCLPAPRKPLAEAHRWKPDFEGENYQAVLYYYSYLPADHVGSITDPKGYPAKAMSPEASALYIKHRAFWEAKHAESKSHTKATNSVRKQAAKKMVEKAAATAGLSKEELESKLDRLSELANQGNLKMAADMIAGFGDVWLYEALLAGASISPEGKLNPGRVLKRFKKQAEFIMLLTMASMPDGVEADSSIRRDAVIIINVDVDNVDVVAEWIAPRLSHLKPSMLDMYSLKSLLLPTAEFLVRHEKILNLDGLKKIGVPEAVALSSLAEELSLEGFEQIDAGVAGALARIKGKLSLGGLLSITEDVARALGCHVGGLRIGLKDLSEPIAAALAMTRGDLEFSGLKTLSSAAAAELRVHVGKLILGDSCSYEWNSKFELNAAVASHLAHHDGPLSLPQLRQVDADTAQALSEVKHFVELPGIEEFPDGKSGVRLCEKLVMHPDDELRFWLRKSPQPECAAALAKFNGKLVISVCPGGLVVKQWDDDALVVLAGHRHQLEINPECLSDRVAQALARRIPDSSLVISSSETILTDIAAEALGRYSGKLWIDGNIKMTIEAAVHLSKRPSMGVYRSKLTPACRKVFNSAGSWTDTTWTRKS